MRTIEYNNKKHYLLTEDELNKLKQAGEKPKNRTKKFTLQGTMVDIFIPFKDCKVANWNEDFNYPEHTGIIYKGKQLTLSDLQYLMRVCNVGTINATHRVNLLPFVKCEVKFDRYVLNYNDIKEIVEEIERIMAPIKNRTAKRKFNVVI